MDFAHHHCSSSLYSNIINILFIYLFVYQLPREFLLKFAERGYNCAFLATGWPSQWAQGIRVPGDVPIEEWDAFHILILIDELSRCGSGGVLWGLSGGCQYSFFLSFFFMFYANK